MLTRVLGTCTSVRVADCFTLLIRITQAKSVRMARWVVMFQQFALYGVALAYVSESSACERDTLRVGVKLDVS